MESPLVIYCPLNKRLLKTAIQNNFHKFLVSFDDNPIFKTFTKRVMKYLKNLPRDKLVHEGVRFWYQFLKARPTQFVNDYNYYPTIIDYFYSQRVYRHRLRYYKLRDTRRYIGLVYINNNFYFVKKFCSLLEMEIYFGVKFKIMKKNYLIKYY